MRFQLPGTHWGAYCARTHRPSAGERSGEKGMEMSKDGIGVEGNGREMESKVNRRAKILATSLGVRF